MGLSNNLTCRKCSTDEETSVHILCECEALASLRHAYLGSFFLDHEDIRKLSIGAIWNFASGTGLLIVQNMGHKGPVLAQTQIPFNSMRINDSLIHSDFLISVTTKMNLTKTHNQYHQLWNRHVQ